MDFCDSVIATVGGPVVGSVVISAAALAACVTLACWPLTRPAPAMPPNTCAHSSSFRPLLHTAFGQSAAGTVGWRVQCLHKSPFNLPRGMSPFSPPLMWLSSWHRQPTCCPPPCMCNASGHALSAVAHVATLPQVHQCTLLVV